MLDMKDTGQDGCKTNFGQERYRTGRTDYRRVAGKDGGMEGCRTGKMQNLGIEDRMDAGHERFRTEEMQDGRDA